jgi:hypothetical protein
MHKGDTAAKRKNFRGSIVGPDALPDARHVGYLEKKSSKGVWQKRWFKTNNSYLVYYAKERSDKALAALDLRCVTVIEKTGDTTFKLELKPTSADPTGGAGQEYKAITAGAADQWVRKLKYRQDQILEMADADQAARPTEPEAPEGDPIHTAIGVFDELLGKAEKMGWSTSLAYADVLRPRYRNGNMVTGGKLKALSKLVDDDSSMDMQGSLLVQKMQLVTLISSMPPKAPAAIAGWRRRLLQLRHGTAMEVAAFLQDERGGASPAFLQQVLSTEENVATGVQMVSALLFNRNFATYAPAVRLYFEEEPEDQSDTSKAEPEDGEDSDEDPEESGPFSMQDWRVLLAGFDTLQLLLRRASKLGKAAKDTVFHPLLAAQLLQAFDSRDWRERDQLMTCLHALYGNVPARRVQIRAGIRCALLEFLYETHAHRGVAHLLSVLASILAGCQAFKPEHIAILHKVGARRPVTH